MMCPDVSSPPSSMASAAFFSSLVIELWTSGPQFVFNIPLKEQGVKGQTPHWSVTLSSSTVSRFLETAAKEVENWAMGLAPIALH